jgi:hypothetical protein
MATSFKMKNSVLHKSATHGSPMQGNFISNVKKAAKKAYDLATPDGLKIINKKIYDKVTGGKGKANPKAKKMMLTKESKKVSQKGEYTTKENPVSRPDNKYEREGDKQYSEQKK